MVLEYKIKGNGKDLKFAGKGPKEVIQMARDRAKVERMKKMRKQKEKDTETGRQILELQRIKREMRLKKLIEGIK